MILAFTVAGSVVRILLARLTGRRRTRFVVFSGRDERGGKWVSTAASIVAFCFHVRQMHRRRPISNQRHMLYRGARN